MLRALKMMEPCQETSHVPFATSGHLPTSHEYLVWIAVKFYRLLQITHTHRDVRYTFAFHLWYPPCLVGVACSASAPRRDAYPELERLDTGRADYAWFGPPGQCARQGVWAGPLTQKGLTPGERTQDPSIGLCGRRFGHEWCGLCSLGFRPRI